MAAQVCYRNLTEELQRPQKVFGTYALGTSFPKDASNIKLVFDSSNRIPYSKIIPGPTVLGNGSWNAACGALGSAYGGRCGYSIEHTKLSSCELDFRTVSPLRISRCESNDSQTVFLH